MRRCRAVVAPRADHHVDPLGDERVDERRRVGRVVAAGRVGEHVDVGVDVGEHAPHDVALALARLAVDASRLRASPRARCRRSSCCRRRRCAPPGAPRRSRARPLRSWRPDCGRAEERRPSGRPRSQMRAHERASGEIAAEALTRDRLTAGKISRRSRNLPFIFRG